MLYCILVLSLFLSKFKARPRIPGYKQKTQGRNLLVYAVQALSRGKRGLKRGIIKPSMLAIEVKTKQVEDGKAVLASLAVYPTG